jgi:hypothetical protein
VDRSESKEMKRRRTGILVSFSGQRLDEGWEGAPQLCWGPGTRTVDARIPGGAFWLVCGS